MRLPLRLRFGLAIVMTLTVSTYGFIPYRCSFQPPSGCSCAYPDRPKVTCLPNEPMTAFPEITSSMKTIHTLDLSDNEITAIEEPVCNNCDSIRRLILSNNKLSQVSGDAVKWQGWRLALQYLDLSYNEFSENQQIDFLKYLVNLKVLKLNNNKLQFFNLKTTERLPKLKELHLDNNPLSYFGIDSASLSTLTISFDPYNAEFAKLSSLDAANLRSIHMMDTTSAIIYMDWTPTAALKYLGFENSHLDDKDLKNYKYNSTSNLQVLSLKENNLDLKTNYFQIFTENARKVKLLDLSYNKITNISGDTFKYLKKLESLYLNNNQINDLDWDFLDNLKNLRHLDLSGNQITNTKNLLKKVEKLRHLHTVKLGDNKFSCDCSNHDLMEIISRQKRGEIHILDPLEIRHSLKCASPASSAGELIASVSVKC